MAVRLLPPPVPTLLLAVLFGVLAVGGAVAAPSNTLAGPGVGPAVSLAYDAPIPEPLRVLRPFDPPAGPYAPGHRGVDLAVGPAQLVRSPAAGRVSFAGQVAGRGVVVVVHPDGITTEYEPVRALVQRGAVVGRGAPLGRLVGTDPGCGRVHCLHWGARRGTQYFDPLLLLRPLGPVRLLPWSRSGPAPQLPR